MSLAGRTTSLADSVQEVPLQVPAMQPAILVQDAARTRKTLTIAGTAIAMCLIWALWPRSQSVPVIEVKANAAASTLGEPLNVKVFDAPVWTLAALPPPPPPPPAPPPALAEQLLAVSMSGEAPQVMFYRPSDDTIVTLHVGDSIGGRSITVITKDKVILVWKRGTKQEMTETLWTDPRDGKNEKAGAK